MRPQKRLPRRRPLTTWWDALLLENRRNGRPRHAMTEILQRALDAGIAPARIVSRHPHDEAPNLREHAGAGACGCTPQKLSAEAI